MSKKIVYILGGFVLGACAGAVGSYIYCKQKFDETEKKINEDLAEYKEMIRNGYSSAFDAMKRVNAGDNTVRVMETPDTIVIEEVTDPATGKKVDYNKLSSGMGDTVAEEYQEFAKQTMNDIYGRLAEREHPTDDEPSDGYSEHPADFQDDLKRGAGPKIIKADIYGDDPKLECKSLYYYTDDDVLATEEDEMVDDISDRMVGNALTKYGFKHNNEDSLYVRNERLGCDYEIIKVRSSFQESRLK